MDKEDTRYMQDNEPEFLVEIAYALPHQQLIVPVRAYPGMTAEQAIQASGILMKFPEIDLSVNKIGLFGKLSKLDTPLRHLDRVEIYRPLIADPKEVRKQRAAEGKVMKKGGGESATAD
jgi:putative ubiquitin-RnfH superfamily antitoxin RatB of RatAB toxin-antitoxin module